MSRVAACCLAFISLSIYGAALSPVASASWLIGGKELAEGSTFALTTTANVSKSISLKIAGETTVKISCKGSTLQEEAAELIGKSEGMAKSLKLESCETVEPATGCALESQPTSITTQAIDLAVSPATKSSEGLLTVGPQTSETLATILFAATNTCSFNSPTALDGAAVLGAPTLGSEEASQKVEGLGSTENSNPLLVGSTPVYIEGGPFLLKLSSGEKFSNVALFSVRVPPTILRGEKVEFTITNISGRSIKPSRIRTFGTEFEFSTADLALCAGEYTAGSSCKVRVLYKLNANQARAGLKVEDENGEEGFAFTEGVL